MLWTRKCLPVTSWFLRYCKLLSCEKNLYFLFCVSVISLSGLHGFHMVWENSPSLGLIKHFKTALNDLKHANRKQHFGNKRFAPNRFCTPPLPLAQCLYARKSTMSSNDLIFFFFWCIIVCAIQTLLILWVNCNMTSLPMSVSIGFSCFVRH